MSQLRDQEDQMHRFVLRQCISHFKQALDRELDETTRATVQDLLLKAERELVAAESIWSWTCPELNISSELGRLAEKCLDAAVATHGADFGSLQIWDEGTQSLCMIAQKNFGRSFVEQFARVHAGQVTTCEAARASRCPVLIEDVETDPEFVPLRGVVKPVGVRAIQTTPVFSSSGLLVGMISTYFRKPRRFKSPISANIIHRVGRLFEHGYVDGTIER
jgi:GAF domain-containing protein